jgi:hypothetical protein
MAGTNDAPLLGNQPFYLKQNYERNMGKWLYDGFPLIDHNLAEQKENSDLYKCKCDVPYLVLCCYIANNMI